MSGKPNLQLFINLGFIEPDARATPERRQDDAKMTPSGCQGDVNVTPEFREVQRSSEKNRGEERGCGGEERNLDGFQEFYTAYPIKRDRTGAEKAWKKLSRLNREKAKLGLPGFLAGKKRSEEKIPYPATYLNGKRWEDETPTELSKPGTAPNWKVGESAHKPDPHWKPPSEKERGEKIAKAEGKK
ncbi:hypothetical protein MYX75_00950 [Acidobacteria bacterium AH-259-A15]|nr:hypothetical protein [Acidobacteria bacterium AH-259-A15]